MEYTVVLLRSKQLAEHLSGDENPQDEDRIYVALVADASDEIDAVHKAKNEAVKADQADLDQRDDVDPDDDPDAPHLADYRTLVVFAGCQEPVLFGFQAH